MKPLCFVLLLFPLTVFSQIEERQRILEEAQQSELSPGEESSTQIDANSICYTPDTQPRFPGGEHAMAKYIADYKYDQISRIEYNPTIYVQFVINKSGDIQQVKIVRGAKSPYAANVIKMIGSMPDWEPGLVNGQPVNTQFILPIRVYPN